MHFISNRVLMKEYSDALDRLTMKYMDQVQHLLVRVSNTNNNTFTHFTQMWSSLIYTFFYTLHPILYYLYLCVLLYIIPCFLSPLSPLYQKYNVTLLF